MVQILPHFKMKIADLQALPQDKSTQVRQYGAEKQLLY